MRMLHPVLFALFLVAGALYEVRPLGSLPEAAACAPVLILIAFGLFALFRFALKKNDDKAALLTTVVMAYLGLTGEFSLAIANVFRDKGWPLLDNVYWGLLVLTGLLILLAAVIWRAKTSLASVNHAVLTMVSALLLMAVGGFWTDRREEAWRVFLKPTPVRLEMPERPHDIYYIILDSYTSVDNLREFWGYDSAELRTFLSENGFQLAPGARSEYNYTTFSLASRLNMKNPPPVFCDWENRYTRNVLYRFIEQSSVPKLLEAAGYKVVNLSMFPLGKQAARYPVSSFLCFNSVLKMIRERSVVCAIFASVPKKRARALRLPGSRLQPFLDLEAVAGESCDQPRFIYAHVLLPHEPMVFNRDGSLHKARSKGKATKEDYLDQLIFTTRLFCRTVSRIMKQYPQPPVIIVQGDHGYRFLKESAEACEKESYGMLNAMLLPGLDIGQELRALPPQNTFRLVFNQLFNAGLPYVTNSVSLRPVEGAGTDE
ncbi:MAG: hypothetical protein R6X19_06625 [Kiritimatiellia bacterium]